MRISLNNNIGTFPWKNGDWSFPQKHIFLFSIEFPKIHDDGRKHTDGQKYLFEGGVGVKMCGNAVASEIVIDGQLIKSFIFEDRYLFQFLQEGMEVIGKLSFVLLFVDLISAVFEDIAVMLNSSIVEFLPLPFVDVLEEKEFLLFSEEILVDDQSWNWLRIELRWAICDIGKFLFFLKGLAAEEKY